MRTLTLFIFDLFVLKKFTLISKISIEQLQLKMLKIWKECTQQIFWGSKIFFDLILIDLHLLGIINLLSNAE